MPPETELAGTIRAFVARFAPAGDGSDEEARRRARIMEVTLEIAAAEGVKGASLRRIAARTGIRTASLYSYFPGGKDELVSTALAEHLESFYRAAAMCLRVDEAPEENLRRLVFTHARWTLENPRIAPAILVLERAHAVQPIMTADTERPIRELHDTYRDLLRRLLRTCGIVDPGDRDRLAALVIVVGDNVDAWAPAGAVDDAQEYAWLVTRRLLGWTDLARAGQRKAASPVRA